MADQFKGQNSAELGAAGRRRSAAIRAAIPFIREPIAGDGSLERPLQDARSRAKDGRFDLSR
jgi:hypothetical protein